MNNFVWTDLSTLHVETAKTFYNKLFGWMYYDASNYHMAYTRGKESAAIFQMPDKFKKLQLASYWMPYVEVKDIDILVLKALKLGAKIEMLPFSFNEKGKIAVINDPAGASITLCEGFSMNGLSELQSEGQFSSFELAVSNLSQVKTFYETLFSWKILKEKDGYHVIYNQENQIASIEIYGQSENEKPANWYVTFNVKDIEQAKNNLIENGGEIISKKQNTCFVQDLFGAKFYIQ